MAISVLKMIENLYEILVSKCMSINGINLM